MVVLSKLITAANGDYMLGDIYPRNKYGRSETLVYNTDYRVDVANGTATAMVASTSDIVSGEGTFSLFLKANSEANANTSGTPVIISNATSTTLNGNVNIKGTQLSQSSSAFVIQPPSNVAVTIAGTSSNVTADNGNLSLGGGITVAGSSLFVGDARFTGDLKSFGTTYLYGALAIDAGQLLLGPNAAAGSGVYIGNSVSNSLASIAYTTTTSFTAAPSLKTSIPLVYQGTTYTTQAGAADGSMMVYSTANTAQFTTVSSNTVSFGEKWRIRWNATDDTLTFEHNGGSGWTAKSTINATA